MSQTTLELREYTVPPDAQYPFYLTAKRYWNSTRSESDPDGGVTLLLLHSTSFHKECWEPTIHMIFSASTINSKRSIVDAWVLDCPNHGVAAVLNEQVLKQEKYACNFTCEKYAFAARRFLASTEYHGIDFMRRDIVGIGHSLGGAAITILQAVAPTYHWKSLILIDPMITNNTAAQVELPELRAVLVKSAYERRDVWPDIQSAVTYCLTQMRMRTWDPRVQQLFIKHALRPHPGSKHAIQYDGLALACTRDEEAAMYRDTDSRSVEDLDRACRTTDVHLLMSGIPDLLPKMHQAKIIGKRKFASIQVLEGCGHMIPQEAPDRLGELIYEILSKQHVRTKL